MWTLYLETSHERPPKLPFVPQHNVNAFLEDKIHDWTWRAGKLHYRSRVADRPVWILLVYRVKARGKHAYSFCESVTGIGRWHIRQLTAAGRKLGGGIDTPTLCGIVQPLGVRGPDGYRGCGGWDISAEIGDDLLKGACPDCVKHYREKT